MKLKLENIGAIRDADIKINGLTVITGENSTGKSTVGKLVYSLVKALNNKTDAIDKKLSTLKSITKDFMTLIKKNQLKSLDEQYTIFLDDANNLLKSINQFQFYISQIELNQEFINTTTENLLFSLTRKIFFYLIHPTNVCSETHMLKNLPNNQVKIFEDFWNMIKQFFIKFKVQKQFPGSESIHVDLEYINSHKANACIENIHYINELLDIIQRCCSIFEQLNSNNNDKTRINRCITQQLSDEFSSGLYNNTFSNPGTIILTNEPECHLHIEIKNSFIETTNYPQTLPYEDTTYIESPIMLYFNEYNIPETTSIPRHIKDLLHKLSSKNKNDTFDAYMHKAFNGIVNGKFRYDESSNQFLFLDNKEQEFCMTNIATGTKSIGLLQLLSENGWIQKDSIIIIDEPEIHLHPKWQLEYCKVISALVSHGISFIITTHSPYIVQALKVYTDQMNISSKANFYITNEETDGVHITETTNKLSAIYEKLTAPLRELM